MLTFDSNGFLIPNTVLTSTLEECKQYFVDAFGGGIRQLHFDKYVEYSNALKDLLGNMPMRQWIDGSFVTKEAHPHDIDLITFVDSTTFKRLGKVLDSFGAKGSIATYGVDAYLLETYPENHRQHSFQLSDMAYWMDHFQKTRKKGNGLRRIEKGFLEIFY